MTVPEEQDPLLNTVLGGARIQRRVSAGLLANVYLGHYERLNVPVAVKVLTPKATAQGMNKERFVREGRALAQLSHANIIKIYNVGHDNGRYFIVMDWIQDGMNLRQLAQSRPLTPVQSLKVTRRLSESLEYIHSKSLIHRDIKPANVCLRKGGVPVLMDFSLIKDQSSDVQLTAPGTIMGTVNFMPPEQAQPGGPFGNVGPWSDVYSVGGTLYWLLTGRPPFKGRTPMETIIKLIREPHVAPSVINQSVPPEVDALIAKCLAKKSDERYQSAAEFMRAIDEVLQVAADSLARGTPPPLAVDEDAIQTAMAAAASAGGTVSQSSAVMGATSRAWGGAGPAPGGPRPPSSGVQPAIANNEVPAAMRAPLTPQPAQQSAQQSGQQQAVHQAMGAGQTAPTGSGLIRPVSQSQAAPRGTTRMAPAAQSAPGQAADSRLQRTSTSGSGPVPAGSGEGRLPGSGSGPGVGQAQAQAQAQQGEQWAPTNGLDVAPDMEVTVRLKGGTQGAAAQAAQAAAAYAAAKAGGNAPPATPPVAAPRPGTAKKDDLKRSWVEDLPSAPSWTEQQKDPNASVLGMRGEDPAAAAAGAPPQPEVIGSPVSPAPAPPRPAPRQVSDRIHKAPQLPSRRSKRSTLEVVLVVFAVIVTLACIAVGSYVIVISKGAP